MAQYGGYSSGGGGGYGQTNPYEQQGGGGYEQQGGRYDQAAGNPYAQQASNPYEQKPAAPQPSYGGRQQQGGYDNRYGQSAGAGGYGKVIGSMLFGW
ncbi:hypothetical protein OEA41_000050 [Lepraria neglecta]|uniref:Uncharacterized protein n=1 Tax=Lepraria neglecta TaxID=209136 RepID=A0AAD9ZFX0_9LECA|nr:hypothetical protein OEA41_000050 [Lepraria neglecta]